MTKSSAVTDVSRVQIGVFKWTLTYINLKAWINQWVMSRWLIKWWKMHSSVAMLNGALQHVEKSGFMRRFRQLEHRPIVRSRLCTSSQRWTSLHELRPPRPVVSLQVASRSRNTRTDRDICPVAALPGRVRRVCVGRTRLDFQCNLLNTLRHQHWLSENLNSFRWYCFQLA